MYLISDLNNTNRTSIVQTKLQSFFRNHMPFIKTTLHHFIFSGGRFLIYHNSSIESIIDKNFGKCALYISMLSSDKLKILSGAERVMRRRDSSSILLGYSKLFQYEIL